MPRDTANRPYGWFDYNVGDPMAPTPGLQEGLGHVMPEEQSPLDTILDMLTPRNYQQQTSFAGGSHYGPSRHAYIPKENLESAAVAIQSLNQAELGEREMAKFERAQSILDSFKPQKMPGGATMQRQFSEASPIELLELGAAGYFGTGGRGGGYGVPGVAGTGTGTGTRTGGSKEHELTKAEVEMRKVLGTEKAALLQQINMNKDQQPTLEQSNQLEFINRQLYPLEEKAAGGEGGGGLPDPDDLKASVEAGEGRDSGSITFGGRTLSPEEGAAEYDLRQERAQAGQPMPGENPLMDRLLNPDPSEIAQDGSAYSEMDSDEMQRRLAALQTRYPASSTGQSSLPADGGTYQYDSPSAGYTQSDPSTLMGQAGAKVAGWLNDWRVVHAAKNSGKDPEGNRILEGHPLWDELPDRMKQYNAMMEIEAAGG